MINKIFVFLFLMFVSCENSSEYHVSNIINGSTIELTNGSLVQLIGVAENPENIKILEHYIKGKIELYDTNNNEIVITEIGKISALAYNSDGDCINELLFKANQISKDSVFSNENPVNEGTRSVVKMRENSGVYEISVEVNGEVMFFIFDTGASLISISSKAISELYNKRAFSELDILGKGQFSDANGDISEGTIINLKTVEIGNRILYNVKACVIENQNAPLLLGQSALKKFGKVTIDYNNSELIFE